MASMSFYSTVSGRVESVGFLWLQSLRAWFWWLTFFFFTRDFGIFFIFTRDFGSFFVQWILVVFQLSFQCVVHVSLILVVFQRFSRKHGSLFEPGKKTLKTQGLSSSNEGR